jgi:quercetin dioxygenase-like cupin family protein
MSQQELIVIPDRIKHHFGGQAYVREGLVKAGETIRKHTHTYDHLSILGSGIAGVLAGSVFQQLEGPAVVLIKAGVHHEIYAITDIVWFCVHGTLDEIDDLDGVEVAGAKSNE